MIRAMGVARAVIIGASALALVACMPPVPQTSTAPALEATGAVVPVQSDRIVSRTLRELAAADEAHDPSLLGERISGSAATSRATEYIVAANGGAAPEAISTGTLAVYTTASETWPRVMVTVAEAADATHTPVVLEWVQDDPRSEYQVRWWAHMVPGGVLPAMPGQTVGAEQLPLDASGFTSTPQQVIDDYVALLNAGASSELNAAFNPDPYRERMFEARTALAATAATRGGTYADTVTARPDQAFVLADAEGGALIFLPVDVMSDFNVAGAQLVLPASDKALLQGTLGARVVHRYEDLIVLRVGAQGSGLLPVVTAADHHLASVATS
jgi:hypothetical protein